MRKGKLFCVGVIPILLCSLALLVLTLAMKWRDVEQAVQQSAQTALMQPEHAWAEVETYNLGRQVLITGAAPSQQAIDDAIAVVKRADGVLSVKHNGEALIAPPSNPAKLSAQLRDGTLILNGTVSSESEVNRLVAAAQQQFGTDKVVSKLNVDAQTKPLITEKVLSALFVEPTNNLSLQLDGTQLNVSGTVKSQAAFDHIDQALRDFPGSSANNVELKLPIAKVDCEALVEQLLTTAKINFATGKAEITEDSFNLLNQIASTAQRCPDAAFDVVGHTDSSGNQRANVELSQRRAEAVVNYLIDFGLPREQFSAIGQGSANPIASNSSAEGRAANRRIEFKLRN